jgi:soluble lytic murein transglycosylase-like protein
MTKVTLTVLGLFTCLLFLVPAPVNCAQLKHSLEKYKGTQLSPKALSRLAPINKYINYYSQFTFFKPRHKVNPDFIRALILAESNADPRAISSKGAMGLGQIIYSTGKQAALELSKSRFHFRHVPRTRLHNLKESDLFDPEMNILLTCYLISKYNYKFKGKLELVLTAWNAGENQKELTKGRVAPYLETQDLIGKVNSYYIDLLKKRTRLASHKR